MLLAIADGARGVADTLRTASVAQTGTSNLLGDHQLIADIESDAKIMDALRMCPAVAIVSSEENHQDIPVNTIIENNTQGYAVAFDPLDGSSIIAADWTVGSIFAIFPGNASFIGRSGRDQCASVIAVHGPRTVLVVARPTSGVDTTALVVQEFTLRPPDNTWILQRDAITIPPEKKTFAPANLRAAADNAAYSALMQAWMGEKYTLRYSGGLVPDVHHILAKNGGVYCNPTTPAAPAKLRVLYECLPLAFIVEAAGGSTMGADGASVLDMRLRGHDDRAGMCVGSRNEVERCRAAMMCEGGV